MADLVKCEIVKFGPCRFIGKSVYARAIFEGGEDALHSGMVFGGMWRQRDWISNTPDGLKDFATDVKHNVALLTWEKYDDKNQLEGYTVGRFMRADTPVPNQMDYVDIPEMYVAKAIVKGEIDLIKRRETGEFFDMIGGAENWGHEEIKRQGIYHYNHIFLAEVYTELPDEDGNVFNWEFWVACSLNNPSPA